MPNACSNVDPEYLAHANTPALARDLDMVRNLTGAETLNFLGFDDGNMIGVVYAALFPDRVGRMVLNGTSSLTDSLIDLRNARLQSLYGDYRKHHRHGIQ